MLVDGAGDGRTSGRVGRACICFLGRWAQAEGFAADFPISAHPDDIPSQGFGPSRPGVPGSQETSCELTGPFDVAACAKN